MGEERQESDPGSSGLDPHWLWLKVAALILLALGLVLIPMAWTVDSVLRERLMRQALHVLQKQDQEWLQQLRNDLRVAESSILSFARLLSYGTERLPPAADDQHFYALFQQDGDGLWRSRRDQYQPATEAGLWAPAEAVDTPEDRAFFLQAKRLMDIYGRGAANHLFANTWALPAENGEIVYWPDEPEFIYKVTNGQDYRPTEWYQRVSPEQNPSGLARWTSTAFDPVPKVWMISVVAPFQRAGRWHGSAGHDLVINDLFQRLDTGSQQEGSEIVVLDREQRVLIASRHQEEIENANGQLKIADLNDRRLAGLLKQVVLQSGQLPDRRPVMLETSDELITALPLDRPEWLIIHSVPRRVARALVEEPLQWLRWGMAISMLTLITACGLVISRDTLRRLRAEQELRANNATLSNYESFINRSPAVVFLWRADPGWPVEFVSENVDQFGYEAADLMAGRVTWINTLAPEDLAHLEAEVARHQARGETDFILEYRVRTAGGEPRWVECRTQLIRKDDGQLRHVQGILLDITARHDMENALRAEHQRHQILFNHSGVGIAYYDREGRLQMMNETACRLLQRELDYLKGRKLEEILPLDAATEGRARLNTCLQDGRVDTYEDEIELPGGRHWFVSTFTCIRDPQGKALGVQVVSQDITDRKQAEQALQVSQDRYRQLFGAISDAIFVSKLEEDGRPGRFIEVNQQACRHLGYTREELLALGPLDITESHPDLPRAQVETALQEYGHAHFEHVHLTKDGQRIPVEVRCTRCVFNDQPIVISLVRDLRERKEAEVARRHSEAQFRTIVETAQEGVWTFDAQARTTFVNRHLADMLGYTVTEMMGRSLLDFMDEAGRAQARTCYSRLQQGHAECHDFRFLRKDGAEIWTMISASPLRDEQGAITGAMALITDVTQRRHTELEKQKLEQRVQQAQRLESLGIMAAGIAHDFNNLLQAILGHTELALPDAPADSLLRESLGEIQKAANRAGVISNQMLAYVGQGSHQRTLIRLEVVLRELQPSLKQLTENRSVLSLTVEPDLPPVLANAAELKQSIQQLVTNAMEAQDGPSGRIALQAAFRPWRRSELQELVGAPELAEGSYLTLTVSDNGVGIDRAAMGHLFEPFFSTKFPGRGLGLMNVLGFVRGHGGGIKVESMPGHGTTFTLVLPEALEPAPTTEVAMPWGWRGQGTILMVDDDAMVLNVGRRLLTELGYNVITAGDGQEALLVYRAQAAVVRCVVLDLVMPDFDGVKTLAALREIAPDLPVVVASAYAARQAAELLKGLSYQGFVHKPYQSAALARLLQGLLG